MKKNINLLIILLLISKTSAQCFDKLSTGEKHSFTLNINGTISGWGNGASGWGALGTGNINNVLTPTQVGTGTTWNSIFSGSYNTFAIKNDGSLWGTGANEQGQLGVGSITNSMSFIQIGNFVNWKTISANREHTLAVKTDGTLWAWGSNYQGKLGTGNNTNSYIPIQIGTLQNWKNVTTGLHQSFGLKTDGTLWAWGLDGSGALGLGNNGVFNTPTQIGVDSDWQMISSGGAAIHTLAIKTNGKLYSFGTSWSGGDGCLGLGPAIPVAVYPTQIGTNTDWKSISVGSNTSFAIKTDGTLWGWGQNDFGQLGDGTFIDKNIPAQIGTDTDWSIVSAGQFHTVALKTNGNLYAWGDNTRAQLGNGNYTSSNLPILINSCSLENEQFNNDMVLLVPNPTNNQINILLKNIFYNFVEIYDLSGKLILRNGVTYSTENFAIDLSTLSKGVYNLLIKKDTETIFIKKIVKN